jgi:ElaA protein
VSVAELRVVVTAADYEAALAAYRDVLGLPEHAAVSSPGGRVAILDAGRATLELADPPHAEYVDEVEVGRRVAGHIRLAFRVPDAAEAVTALTGAGATVVAEPTRTPWKSLNARLDGPADLHLTLFEGQSQDMGVRSATFGQLDAATLYALLRLRMDVFVVEQECPYPDLDGRDTEPGTRHLWLERDGTPIAYLRLLSEEGEERIGRVCVAIQARGGGHAERLMAAALEQVGDRPCGLEAQSYLVDFYARFGFEVAGPEYVEDGIPHTPMRRG